MNIGYEKLENAVRVGELKDYLTSRPKYAVYNSYGVDVMNDFYIITVSLNDYGENRVEFVNLLYKTIIEILKENKIFYTYSIINIIKEQIELEFSGKAKINFIDNEMLNLVKGAILKHKSELEKMFDYDGQFYSNGLMGLYNNMNTNIYNKTGRRIF